MSKANAKRLTGDAPEEAAQAAEATSDATTAGDTPVAVVPAPAPAAPADEFHGRGGLYTMKKGRRVLVSATQVATTKES